MRRPRPGPRPTRLWAPSSRAPDSNMQLLPGDCATQGTHRSASVRHFHFLAARTMCDRRLSCTQVSLVAGALGLFVQEWNTALACRCCPAAVLSSWISTTSTTLMLGARGPWPRIRGHRRRPRVDDVAVQWMLTPDFTLRCGHSVIVVYEKKWERGLSYSAPRSEVWIGYAIIFRCCTRWLTAVTYK